MDFLYKVVSTVNTYLTDYILIFLLVGTGIFFTIRTRFVQVRCFGEGMKSVFGKISLHGKGHGGNLTSFQALATAVAAQVGTGNIVGACGAILIGGPGAIVENENEDIFHIGIILKAGKNKLTMREFDADGKWQEETKIPYKEITSVSFKTRYIDNWRKYLERTKEG